MNAKRYCCKFVIASGDALIPFDLVEEALEQHWAGSMRETVGEGAPIATPGLAARRSSSSFVELIQIKAPDRRATDRTPMPRHPLARDVVVVVAIKLVLVIAAATFLFGPGQRPRIDAGAIATRLIDSKDIS